MRRMGAETLCTHTHTRACTWAHTPRTHKPAQIPPCLSWLLFSSEVLAQSCMHLLNRRNLTLLSLRSSEFYCWFALFSFDQGTVAVHLKTCLREFCTSAIIRQNGPPAPNIRHCALNIICVRHECWYRQTNAIIPPLVAQNLSHHFSGQDIY